VARIEEVSPYRRTKRALYVQCPSWGVGIPWFKLNPLFWCGCGVVVPQCCLDGKVLEKHWCSSRSRVQYLLRGDWLVKISDRDGGLAQTLTSARGIIDHQLTGLILEAPSQNTKPNTMAELAVH